MKAFFRSIVVFILTLEARAVLLLRRPKIIAVTGSVGKTSTKDAIFQGLSACGMHVGKSQKTYNSEIGVPLAILGLETAWGSPFGWFMNIIRGGMTVLSLRAYPKILVLEAGVDHPGDMRRLTRWLRPDIAVFTRLASVPVHVEFFENPEALIREKKILADALRTNGLLIVNGDDPLSVEIQDKSKSRTSSYGFSDAVHVRGSHENVVYTDGVPRGISFRVNVGAVSVPVTRLGVLGRQHSYPVLAAAAVAVEEGCNLIEVLQGFASYESSSGRMRLLKGIHDTTIIDDTYNASPIALEEALHTLSELTGVGKKVVVLGKMAELGQFSEKAHTDAGVLVAKSAAVFFAVGEDMKKAAHAAQEAGLERVYTCNTASDVGEELSKILEVGDIVLVKGSQSARMEKTVERILKHPERKKELLVRQEDEWKHK